jgi:F0F1-type ATP synthase gamma subunit
MDSGLEVILIIISAIVSVMVIVAILKIAKYQKATMALTAYIAEKQGVEENLIRELVKDTGEEIMFHKDEQNEVI